MRSNAVCALTCMGNVYAGSAEQNIVCARPRCICKGVRMKYCMCMGALFMLYVQEPV